MSDYPFRHSTYYTRRDDVYTTELPPMNSEEDVLQEHLMHHRQYGRSSYLQPPKRKKKREGRLVRFFKKLRRGYWGITDALRGRDVSQWV